MSTGSATARSKAVPDPSRLGSPRSNTRFPWRLMESAVAVRSLRGSRSGSALNREEGDLHWKRNGAIQGGARPLETRFAAKQYSIPVARPGIVHRRCEVSGNRGQAPP